MRISAFFLLLLPLSALQAQGKNVDTLFDKTLRSCVFIASPLPDKPRMVATGTGSFIGHSSGTNLPIVITNYHVVAPCIKEDGKHDPVLVMFPAKNEKGDLEQSRELYMKKLGNPNNTIRGKIVAYLKNKDLALVELQMKQLPKGVTLVGLAQNSPKPGARVHTIGNTGAGGMWSYTEGSVRSVYVKKIMAEIAEGKTLRVEARVIESSNPTNKGDSGGPLVNDSGELVGVTQGGVIEANALSTFIDINEVKALLQQAKVQVPRRGTSLASKPDNTKESSSDVAKTNSEKPAQKADPREAAAESKLSFAKRAMKVKDFGVAEDFLKQIMIDYEDTKAVVEAKSLLEEIKKGKK